MTTAADGVATLDSPDSSVVMAGATGKSPQAGAGVGMFDAPSDTATPPTNSRSHSPSGSSLGSLPRSEHPLEGAGGASAVSLLEKAPADGSRELSPRSNESRKGGGAETATTKASDSSPSETSDAWSATQEEGKAAMALALADAGATAPSAGPTASKAAAAAASAAAKSAGGAVQRRNASGRTKAVDTRRSNAVGGNGARNGSSELAGGIGYPATSAGSQAMMGGVPPAMGNMPAAPFVMPGVNSGSDRRIISALAAPEKMHQRLLRIAAAVPEILMDSGDTPLCTSVELYGSLSLDPSHSSSSPGGRQRWRKDVSPQQDWPAYYVNGRSDVDFVVEMRSGVAPNAIVQRLLKKGPWRLAGQVHVHKFASTQYTLLGNLPGDESGEDSDASAVDSEVYLDITCIEDHVHFERFRVRQEAFRNVFLEVRARMEAQHGADGALALDAYVHLLKAFAAKVPGNALTGFQATCIGLFTLQIGHFRMKSTQSIALCLFEGFLRFCWSFYRDVPRSNYHHRQCALDLSNGGRWSPRINCCWRSEIYFMAAETSMNTKIDERMNVAHSLEPARVALEAQALLNRAFSGTLDG
eukprot:TRINITY_DN5800_c4_g1_i1.p1 TRINITY_DN5800_c4_g1~~TRINITY_DN5800_c4_g1_i1.p1  ORF type:complete len:585 (+),score=96.25 TRINITY_DN5800_c4_g1_i1:174-1928(+)